MLWMSKEAIMLLEYKKRILLKEFDFLSRILEIVNTGIDEIKKVNVKRVDENLLKAQGESLKEDWPYGRNGSYERDRFEIYFSVNKDGEIFQIPSVDREESEWVHSQTEADTIGEELLKKSIIPEYIVLVYKDYETSRGNVERDECGVVIYKAINFDMKEHHIKFFRKAAEDLEAEMRTFVFNNDEGSIILEIADRPVSRLKQLRGGK